MRVWGLSVIAAFWALSAVAEEISVAVASNFLATAQKIAAAFEAETGHKVLLSNGSTGLLFAQISSGAPFDVFLSADDVRPAKLLSEGRARAVQPYAVGRLVLAARDALSLEAATDVFTGKTVALADPTVAPYGLASTRAMERLGLDTATFRPVVVANVGQAASIFVTGNADLAFVSAAQVPKLNAPVVLDLTGVAPDILQSAALLNATPATEAFWEWLAAEPTRRLIEADGYVLP